MCNDDVDILVLEEAFLSNILFQEPETAVRFFHYLTRLLCVRFVETLDMECL